MKIHIVRVFVDSQGKYGNPVGIVIDERNKLDTEKRQSIATKLNRKLEILHGKGSVIYSQPFKNDLVDVGGRVSTLYHKTSQQIIDICKSRIDFSKDFI